MTNMHRIEEQQELERQYQEWLDSEAGKVKAELLKMTKAELLKVLETGQKRTDELQDRVKSLQSIYELEHEALRLAYLIIGETMVWDLYTQKHPDKLSISRPGASE